MKREHSAYFEYFTEPPVKGSTDWTWKVLVHRIPAVTKDEQLPCAACEATGVQKDVRGPEGQPVACAKCLGLKHVINKISVPEELAGTAKNLVDARTAAQQAGAEAVEKHRIPAKEGGN